MKLTERSLAPSVGLTDFVHVVRVDDFSQDVAGSSYKAQVQQLLDLASPVLYITGGTYDPNTGILALNDNTGGTVTISGTYSFENTANKQDSMTVDGFAVKYPTVDAVNFLVNNIARASINTGFIDVSDSFVMTRPDDFTLRLNASNKGIIYQSLLQTPPYAPSSAILNIPQTDYPLSGISFTGDGIYVRFIGFDDTSQFVFSDTTYETSISVAQLGVLLIKVSGGTTSFLDDARGIINKPSICKYNNLELHMLGLQSNVIVRPNSNMTVNNTSGSIKGMSVNWQGADNDVRPVPFTGTSIFTHLSYLNTQVATPPVFTTAVTTDQYWNGSFLQSLSTSGAASIQRWYVAINGRLGLQYGEQEYATLQIAKDNVSTATFLDVIPAGTFAEIARMVAIRDTTNLSNTQQCVFYSNTGGGSAGGTSSTVWGGINGSIIDQIDLQAQFATKQNIITTGGTAYIVPRWDNSGTTLINSNISDVGTAVTITTDASIRNINIGRGRDTSNLFFGFQALGTASTTNNTSVAFGDYALGSLTTGGTNNTALGYSSLFKTTTGNENTAIGQYAAYFNTTGQYNLAIGNSALQNNIASTQNVAIGAFAIYTFTGGAGGHTAIGVSAMQKQINGESNLAVGNSALYNGTTCIRNTAIGTLAMYGRLNIPITGQYNIAVGFQASRAITTGSNNLVIGLELNDGVTTGSNNIVLDPINRPGIATGSGNVIIGGFNSSIPDVPNGVYIGNGSGNMRLAFDAVGNMILSATPVVGTSVDKVLVRTSIGHVRQVDNPISSTALTSGQVAYLNTPTTLSGSTGFTWNDGTKRLTVNGSFVKSGGTSTQYLMADGSVTTTTSTSGVTGSGTTNFIPRFSTSATVVNSQFFDDGTNISIANSGLTYNPSGYSGSLPRFTYGINSPQSFFINVEDTSSFQIRRAGSGFGPQIRFGNASGTVSARTNPNAGAILGQISFEGYNGLFSGANTPVEGFQIGALIKGVLAVSATTASTSAYLAFSTAPSGSTTVVDRMYVNNTGNILIATGTDNLVDRLQVNGSILATAFTKNGGTSTQFLMADGSVTTGVVTGSGSANAVTRWSSSSAITNSTLLSDNGTNFGVGTTSTEATINILTPSIVGRERILVAKVSDAGTDQFGVANGTAVATRFAPVFYNFSSGDYSSLGFRAMTTVSGDSFSGAALFTFQPFLTDSSSDPNGGAFARVANRPLLAMTDFTGNTYFRMNANGNLMINTTADTVTDKLQVSGSVIASGYKVSSGSTTQLLKADGSITVGYKVYTALITQTTTNDPTPIVLENTLGAPIVWTRTGVGTYQGLLTSVFTANKTFVQTTKDSNNPGNVNVLASSPSTSQIIILTYSGGTTIDDKLSNTSIEIRVYN